jgi:hypothetical protein
MILFEYFGIYIFYFLKISKKQIYILNFTKNSEFSNTYGHRRHKAFIKKTHISNKCPYISYVPMRSQVRKNRHGFGKHLRVFSKQ